MSLMCTMLECKQMPGDLLSVGLIFPYLLATLRNSTCPSRSITS